MGGRVGRVFRLERGEGAKVLHFTAIGFFLQLGTDLGTTAGDSVFLTQLGAQALPRVYVAIPVLMLLYIGISGRMVARFGLDRFFDGVLAVLLGAGLLFALAFAGDGPLPGWLPFAAKLYGNICAIGLFTLFWTFLDGFFDLVDAKRLFSLFAAGSACGAMAAGALAPGLASGGGVSPLYAGWVVATGLAWLVLVRTRRRWPRIDADDTDDAAAPTAGAGLVSALVAIARSPFGLCLTLGLFLVLFTGTLTEFQFLGVLSEGRTEAGLAALLGHLTLVANAGTLLITLLLFNPAVARFGVLNLALVQPLAFAACSLWMLLQPGTGAAIAGFLAFNCLLAAVEYNNVNLLFAGLPVDRNQEGRTVIEGLADPLAIAAAGSFLLVGAPLLSAAQLSATAIAAAAAALGVAVALRFHYPRAIAANIRHRWFDAAPAATAPAAPAAPQPLAGLLDGLADCTPAERSRRLGALGAHRTEAMVGPLLAAAGSFDPAQKRAARHLIVGVGRPAIPLLVRAAQDPRHSLRARSVALRSLALLDMRALQGAVTPLLDRTARRAYAFTARADALRRAGGTDAGSDVLLHIYQDYPHLAVEVTLEALMIAGRLPPFEAIAAALAGGPSRNRGFAVETVRHGAGPALARLLDPWLSGQDLAAQTAHGRRLGLVPDLSVEQVLDLALDSGFPLEAAAAGQAWWERGDRTRLPRKAADLPHKLLADTIRVLEAGHGMTPVDTVRALTRTPVFARFHFTALEFLAPTLREHAVPEGTVLSDGTRPATTAWLVVTGQVLPAGPGRSLGPGELVAAEAVTGRPARPARLIAGQGLRVIAIERDQVMACAAMFPATGLDLLRARLAP